MTIDIDLYKANKTFVISWFYGNGQDVKRTISMMSLALFVPCIVVAYWVGEETNWHPDAVSSIENLTAFYGYTEIKNKPPGAPV
jgi:hypothetical protein